MSREIKFRALLKDQHFKGWLYWEITDGFSSPRDTIDVDTLGQFTGLLDKNGKEIYEGDIVQESDEIDGSKYPAQEVKYIMSAGLIGFYPVTGDTLEVIGNIYENPELVPQIKIGKA